jgi:anaerobic ribonucleoside-triphosphate reductase
MIKDVEVAMVHAANYALEAQERNPGADVEQIIKHFLKDSSYDVKSELKIYSIAAVNEILKLKQNKANKGKNNKQLIQMFVKNVPEISRRIKEEESE